MYTQGCQGCRKTKNFVRNSKILIARSTIQPKLSKIKPLRNATKFLKKWHFFLLNDGWMVDLAMGSFRFLTIFLIFWHPWYPWICIRSVCWVWNLKQIEAILPSVALVILQMSSVCISFYRLKVLMQMELISKITNEKKV